MMIEVVNNVQVCFGIMYRRENQRQYELRADTVSECKAWIDAIKMARSGQSYHYHYLVTITITVSECKAWIDAIKMARSGQSLSLC